MRFIQSVLYFLPLAYFNCWIIADLPQLSSIDPIEFDEVSQKLVARGDALFEFDSIKVRADQITFDKKNKLLDASGNINFTSKNHRLLSDGFVYEVDGKSFSIDNIKYGHWPYFISAKSGGGSLESIDLNKATFYYGEPNKFGPNIRAVAISINNRDNAKNIAFKKVTFKLGNVPIFYIPKLKYSMDYNPFLLASKVGYSGDFGAYFKSLLLLPVNQWLKVGLNLDYYSERGWLLGPAAHYYKQGDNYSIKGAISHAAIDDQAAIGDLGVDSRNNPIDPERHYTLVQHKQIHGDNLTLSLQVDDLSDSEIIRDFKEDIYLSNLSPLSYFEANYINNQLAFGSFVNFDYDHYARIRERLPEISVTYLPSNIGNSKFFHKGKISYSEFKEATLDTQFSSALDTLEYSNYDASYSATGAFIYKNRLRISPKLQVKFSNFTLADNADPNLLQFDQDYGFLLYGLDLESEYQALYPTKNSIWGIDGLRHLFKPSISFRNIKAIDQDSEPFTPLFSNPSFSMPFTDLDNHRDIESIDELLMTRLNLKNYFQTRLPKFGSTNLMELNLTADFYHRYAYRQSSIVKLNKNAIWAEYALNPAPWLKLQLASRIKTEDAKLNENKFRLTLLDAEQWQLGLSTYFIENIANQFSLDYFLKINENIRFTSLLRGNITDSEITRFRVGIDSISKSSWKTTYSLNYRKDLRRENKLSFDLGFELLPY